MRDTALKAGEMLRDSVEGVRDETDDGGSDADASPHSVMDGFREVHAEEDPRGPAHRGFLLKKSKGLFGRGATWTQRMFLLEDHVLSYHALTTGGPLAGEATHEDVPEVDTSLAPNEARRLQIRQSTQARVVPQASGPTPWRLRVSQTKNEVWDICAPTEVERDQWLAKIIEARRPVWQNDSVPGCKLCRSIFGAMVWRHHCRSCGGVFCEGCAPLEWNRPLPDLGYYAPVRVCRTCFPQRFAASHNQDRGNGTIAGA